MKGSLFAVAAALAVGASAANHHAHDAFHKRGLVPSGVAVGTGGAVESCGCTTRWETVTGEPTLHNPPPTSTKETSSSVAPVPTTSEEPIPVVTIPVVPLPTPSPTTLQPGTHTIPATTITVTEETTVCGATSTEVPEGTHTYGGVTTVVTTETTVTCPVATVSTSNGVTTSVIVETTYVCPTAGTYTIAPSTTTVTESTVFVYPTPTTVVPGTYTQPAITTTITETDYVVYCPYTSSEELPVPTSTSPAPVETSAPAQTSEPSKPSPNTGGLGTDGDQWAITYTPYDQAGECKDAASVLSDLKDIASKGFTAVRLYSADKTDCNGLENVSAGCEAHGLNLIVGVYIKETGIEGAKPQITSLSTFTRWDLVVLVVIGNESIFNGVCSAEDLAAFITSSKQVFQSAGYTGPVTTTETLNVLQQHKSVLCEAVDVVGANIHPFFNSATIASKAGEFVKGQLDIVDQLCPGKTGINLETGWPSAGKCNGLACPGPLPQADAIKSIRKAVGGKSVVFSYHNDDWKNLGAFDCERSWGISSLFDIVGAVVDGVADVVDAVGDAVEDVGDAIKNA